jgi:hypothetical protein
MTYQGRRRHFRGAPHRRCRHLRGARHRGCRRHFHGQDRRRSRDPRRPRRQRRRRPFHGRRRGRRRSTRGGCRYGSCVDHASRRGGWHRRRSVRWDLDTRGLAHKDIHRSIRRKLVAGTGALVEHGSRRHPLIRNAADAAQTESGRLEEVYSFIETHTDEPRYHSGSTAHCHGNIGFLGHHRARGRILVDDRPNGCVGILSSGCDDEIQAKGQQGSSRLGHTVSHE